MVHRGKPACKQSRGGRNRRPAFGFQDAGAALRDVGQQSKGTSEPIARRQPDSKQAVEKNLSFCEPRSMGRIWGRIDEAVYFFGSLRNKTQNNFVF